MNMWRKLLLCSLGLGITLSWKYINPYDGSYTVSEALLQLSGARGEFALGPWIDELLEFSFRMIPSFIFQIIAGTYIFKHYSTASVYIFSRISNRAMWCCREIITVIIFSFIYQCIFIASAMLFSAFRFTIIYDPKSTLLLIYHIMLWSMWTASMAIAINMLSISLRSSVSFVAVIGVQMFFIASLSILRHFLNDPKLYAIISRLNPISCLILCWQSSRIYQAINEHSCNIFYEDSIFIVLLILIIITLITISYIKRKEIVNMDEIG